MQQNQWLAGPCAQITHPRAVDLHPALFHALSQPRQRFLPCPGTHTICTLNSCARADNRLIMAALYVSETTPLSLHFGEPLGSPFFHLASQKPRPKLLSSG